MEVLPYRSQGTVRVLSMRRYLALTALAATALLSGCAAASADAGDVVDTKTPAPEPLAEADYEQIVSDCREAALTDVLHGWPGGEAGAAEEFDSTHNLDDAVVTAADDGWTVKFPGEPGHMPESVDMVCTWTDAGATARVDS